uniref:Uncharacterized protein LOC104226282 n=1 Tax=Nicotiana sylvestris TaxID=4096 RepID=A0A1U7WQL3_NICSY|nr:PREDICTED: uncharacterized protein LOC104226282 [Nicotiana sylvestris]
MANCTFIKEQYDHIVQLLNKDNSTSASITTTPAANATSIPCALLASNTLQEWFIDIGAINHMIADLELLNRASLIQTNQQKKVHLPNGETTQELFSGRVKAIGREDSALYILSRQKLPGNKAISLNTKETEINKEVSSNDIDFWHRRLGHVSATVLKKLISQSQYDRSLFIKKTAEGITMVLIYVDDMLITGDSLKLIEETKSHLQQSFKMKDLGELKYFLGIEFARSKQGILMHQRKYTLELISETDIAAAKLAITPLDVYMKLTTTEYDEHIKKTKSTTLMNEELADINSYQRLIGKLLYLTMTRPDISFSVQTLSQFLQRPKKSHMEATLRIVKYIKNSLGQGILLYNKDNNTLSAYCDADWAACPFSRKFVSGYFGSPKSKILFPEAQQKLSIEVLQQLWQNLFG